MPFGWRRPPPPGGGQVDEDRWTPLHGAACFGEVAVVRDLVEHGANLVAVNAENDQPVDVAVDAETRAYLTGATLAAPPPSPPPVAAHG